MAQNITLLGASYTAVPAVTLPKTGGGTAKFSDASVTTAVESDVAEGKTFLLADGSIGIGTASGGGDEPSGPTETLLGQTPYTLTEDANIRLKSTSETTYSTGSGVVKDFADRENQTLTSTTLTDQGAYWELADNGGAEWYASEMTFTISGLTAGNTYTARIGAAGDGTTSMSGYWLIYDQSSSTLGDTPLVSQALDITDGALQFTPTESTILVRVLPSDSYYWDQGVKTSRFSYFRIEGEVSGTFTGSVDLGQLASGITITSTPSCDVYAVTESSGGTLRGKTCVCLGDSVTGLMAPPNDYPSVLASNTGMTVINGGFEGCRMSDTHPSATYAAFSAVKLADAIATGTWTTQDANISGFESGSYAPAHLTALKAVNWSNVDYLTVFFGGNDAGDQYVDIDNAQNPTDTTTYVGAARYVYNRIHTAYPNIKIMFFVPMYRYWISEGKDSDEMTFTLGGNTYHYYDWGDALIASPPASGVPVIDMYRTLGINASNRTTYLLTSDQTHPSVAGCELIAQKFQTELTNHFLPSGGGSTTPTLVTKEITSNGTYSASDDSADGYSSVTVNVNQTDSIVVKSRDSDGYPTELDYYNSDGIVPAQTFCNTRSVAASGWCYGKVTKINLKGSNSFRVYGDAFRGMYALTDPDFSKITELVNNGSNNTGNQATFRTCAGLLTVNAPNLTGGLPVYCFFDCKKLVSVYLPKINAINGYSSNRGSFGSCVALTTCEFGSVGYPITFVQNYAFHSCTAIETMTFYAKGDYVDELLANVRNCVTTGTIIVKASEDTTYGGTSYAAGDTIVTSTP